MFTSLQVAFAGLGKIALHEGVAIAVIIICILLELGATYIASVPVVGPFLSPILVKFRRDLLWVAAFVAVCTFLVYPLGVRDEHARCVAQSAVINKTVHRSVTRATAPSTRGVRDKWDRDWPAKP